MAKSTTLSFRGGSVTPGQGINAGDIKKLILSYYNEDGITPNQKTYDPVADSDTVIPVFKLRIEDYMGSLLATYNPMYDDVTIRLPSDGLVRADSADTDPKTLIDKLEVVDNVRDPEDPQDPPLLSLETTVDGHGNRKAGINEDNLQHVLRSLHDGVGNIIDVLNNMDFDEVPHGSFGSSLNQSPGDGTSTSIQVSIFRPIEATVGDAISWTKTTEIGGEDFGTVTLEPGTYIICSDIMCQWVGVPRGTYLPQVGNVLGEPFDFSQQQEVHRRMTNVVTVSTTTQFKMRINFDAETPVMGFWINSAQIVKIAGGMSQTNVTHDSTLTGKGSVAEPLGVTPAAFGQIKNIPTSISQFRNGDVIPVDGPNGPAKMAKGNLFKETAQNALVNTVALRFDATRTSENPYKVGEIVIYEGKIYRFKVEHYGVWLNSHVSAITNLSEISVKSTGSVGSSAPYDDLNTYPVNEYVLQSDYARVSNKPVNSPFHCLTLSPVGNTRLQYFISQQNEVFIRSKYGNSSWGSWSSINNSVRGVGLKTVTAPYDDLNTFPNNEVVLITTGYENVANKPINEQFSVATISNSSSSHVRTQIVTTQSGKIYVRSSFGARWSIWVRINKDDSLSYAGNPLMCYDNMLFIGDSLTASQVWTSADPSGVRTAHKTYPQIMAYICNCSQTTLAGSGYTAKMWWDNFKNRIPILNNALAVVYLGTNSGLTDTLEEDAPESDPIEDWADTNTGDYAKIISTLKTKGYKILCVKPFEGGGDLATTKKVIEKISDRFGCCRVDAPFSLERKYYLYPDMSGANGAHYNDLGYSWFAGALINAVASLPETGDDNSLKYIIPA